MTISAPKGPPWWGKYRGTVTKNADPLKRGRIRATVEEVFGKEESGWAEPAFPYAGPQVGMFFIPPEKAMVWIEFEHGDSKYPVWTGCFLREGVADLPLPVAPDPNKKIIRTDKFMITIDDTAGKLSIDSLSGPVATPRITIQNNVLTIENGASPLATIEMNGNSVAINGTALEVT
jgi:uncharacterized protein involved in type VI secretion and phage assembly